jgi:hypothetical protein
MLHVVKGTPPAEDGQGSKLDRAGSRKEDARSIAKASDGNKGRSIGHPCWYRVGRAQDCDVYWHPSFGLCIERDHSSLEDYTGPVEFLANPDDYRHLSEDVAINRNLIDAMPDDLYEAFELAEEDAQAYRVAEDWADTQVKDEMRTHVAETEVF